jgi:hypothetical protein
VVQTVNIHNHVPMLLDLLDSNYSLWRCLIEFALGKFGLVAVLLEAEFHSFD